ncbi:HK97 family phage prohead protease [Azospirillum soli]|uniref:HK97 family phage prohead protease n=1 Tax=Azospirillum soli TaxID=1304799 RepID=UPI001AE50AD7|nr:HK97 family phage prohead protease [Azospirillum soli]MBP2315987.1 HK97 family phage prohead protease [Azospirillum soli]
MTTQRRDIEIRFATEGEAPGTFTGYGAVFGVVDSYRTVFMPGAFAASLKEHAKAGTRPLMLWQHDPDEPIGVWLEVREDAKGLFVRGQLVLEAPGGAKAHALMKAGALDGLSVGFRTLTARTLADGTRAITAAELIEISPVVRPSNVKARITGVRTAAGPAGLAAHLRRAAALIGGTE